MSARSTAVLIGAALAVTVGLGLKVLRYDRPPSVGNALFEARLQQMLDAHDWRLSERRKPGETGEPYPKLNFRKAGCTKPLVVAVIGTTDGLAPYLRSRYGADLSFVQDGELRSEPDLTRLQLRKASQLTGILQRSPDVAAWPIIAIAPGPAAAGTAPDCRPPASPHWRTVYQ